MTSTTTETQPKKNKLTREQKQQIALERQKERDKHKGNQNTETFYCTNKDLMFELEKWKNSAEKVEDRIISEELGKMMLQIATRLTNHSKFKNYDYSTKQDMISYATFKMVQGLRNYNFAFSRPFAYLTQAAYNAFINVLSKHYKQINLRRDLMKMKLAELESNGDINSS